MVNSDHAIGITALLMGWVMHFWVCAAIYRLQWRTVPPLEAVRLYPLRLNSASAVLAGLGFVALSVFMQAFATQPLLVTLPVFHLLPWEAMLYADALYPTPVGQVPAWAFLSYQSPSQSLLITRQTLQRLPYPVPTH